MAVVSWHYLNYYTVETLQGISLRLLAAFRETLLYVEASADSAIKKAEAAIFHSLYYLRQLKQLVQSHSFADTAAEICFFKDIKPAFLCEFIYYTTIHQVYFNRPPGGIKVQQDYLEREQEKLHLFFMENKSLYCYHRSGSTLLDDKYFVRGQHALLLNPDNSFFDPDPVFSTGYDHTFSKILAHERLEIFLRGELAALNEPMIQPVATDGKSFLAWTDSKTALVELMYALHSQGVFNNGQASVKDIASYLAEVFHIDLQQYYHTFLQIRMRKSGQIKFIEELKESLDKRIREVEENQV